MNASAYWMRVDGYAATEIAAHTPPTWETVADGGVAQISWAFAISPRSQHQALRAGRLVEVMCGLMPVAKGLLTEPDRTTGECVAYGLSSALRRRLALDSLNAATRDVGAAVTQAIANGWPGSNPDGVGGVASGDATGNPTDVGKLLDDYATQTAQRWGVDASGSLYLRADQTEPTWLAAPGTVAFGTTDEGVATRLAGRYDTGAGYATAFAGPVVVDATEEAVDLTDRGPMTQMAAEAILSGMMIRRGDRQWTNGATLTREQLTNRGGTPAALQAVVAGSMIRVHGFGYGGSGLWLDTVIGKTRYTAGEDSIYIEPANTAPRNFVDVIAAA